MDNYSKKNHLPVIEEKNVKQKKETCRKVSGSSIFSKISFPKIQPDEVSQEEIGAGEPWNLSVNVLGEESNTPLRSSYLELKAPESGMELSVSSSLPRTDQNVIGISECQVDFKVNSSDLSSEEILSEESSLEESNALKRWRYWLKDKIHMQKVLSKKLGRNPCDLLIHDSDKNRPVLEDKALLTYSQIPEADKWRGHPFFWKERPKIGRRLPDECDTPQLYGIQTKPEKGELPEMEFIGIPDIIRKEKGYDCIPKNPVWEKWEKIPYRQEQISRFKKQRKKMKPHDILMDDLVVLGANIYQEPKVATEFQPPEKKSEEEISEKLPNVPEIIITEEELENLDYRPSVFCLVINDEEIKYEIGTETCQDPDKVFTWQVDFGVSTVGSLVEKVLRVENKGTIAVAYDWIYKKAEEKQSLDLVKPKAHEPCFFFNKNSGLFLPGQIYNLKFYHQSKSSGIRKEVCYLKTKPPLSVNEDTATIKFSALATEEICSEKDGIKAFLRRRVGEAIARFILKIILYRVFNPSEYLCGIEYRSLFLEKELFEYHNSKHYYHSSIVKELQELYDLIPNKVQREWDLSLNSFVEMIKRNPDAQEENSLFVKISEDSRKLFRPNYLLVRKEKKQKMTFEILCKMATLIEEDYNYINGLLSTKKEGNPSILSLSTNDFKIVGEGSVGGSLYEIKPTNYMFFQMILYQRMYERLREAVESIAGMIETSKLFESNIKGQMVRKPCRRY